MAFRVKLSKVEFRMNCHIDKFLLKPFLNCSKTTVYRSALVSCLPSFLSQHCKMTQCSMSRMHGAHSEKAGQSGRVRHVATGYYANVASQNQQTIACSKRSDSGERCRVKKAMKSRGGLGREVREPPSLLFFRAPFYFAPLPTI